MAIIGKLIKKTSEISYKRNINKGINFSDQVLTLFRLLNKCKKTTFGKYHRFKFILSQQDIISEFQAKVPITDYEEFNKKWLQASMDGEKDHTWKGRINYFALSSGTTGSPSKRIPVTKNMIRSFQRTSLKQISTLSKLNLSDDFYKASILAVGGSTKIKEVDHHFEGDLSGILKKHTSLVAEPFTKPEQEITDLKNWGEKLDKMIEAAPNWDIGVVAGIPSWCILLMEKIVDHYQLKTIHDIWPNFDVYVHGGVFMDPYIPRLEKITRKKVHLLDTYLASEGYFAYQVDPNNTSMKLLIKNGIFFEFIPFNSDFFDENGELKDKHTAFTLLDVQEGIDYAMVISTNAGLWRYIIGDLIKFTNVDKREIKITGRIKQFLSLTGEHLSLENINTALLNVSKELSIEIPEYCIYADADNQLHSWFLGIDREIDKELILNKLDAYLKELNDDYAYCRNYNLGKPTLEIHPVQKFYDFLDSIGKSGAQNKFPRVLNSHQSKQWLTFING